MNSKLLGGRYQVLEILAAGGFSQTYIAQDIHRPSNPKCVVKHLVSPSRESSFLYNARRLFQAEAETLEKLGHNDQIPRLLAHFEENREFYLVQEFIPGHPLSAELAPDRYWSEFQVVQLLQEILGILEFVHFHGLIHRDIKPSNLIRRQQDSRLVLIDFGSVKQMWTQAIAANTSTPTTIVIGTPGYISTEQGRGKPRPNSDLYALGMIGIQALTGMHPTQLQEESETGEILWQHHAQVSEELASILSKMVRYHFKERYQTAIEVLQALQMLSVSQSTSQQQPPPVTLRPDVVLNQPISPNAIRAEQKSSNATSVSIPVSDSTTVFDLSASNSARRRSQPQMLFGAGITASLLTMVAGYTIYWQPRTTTLTTLDAIENLKTAGKYNQCIDRAILSLKQPTLYSDAQALLHECQLAKAQQLATENNFPAAISEASKLPQSATMYANARQLIDRWSGSILELAINQYQSGQLKDAIATTEAIPQSSTVYQKAQVTVKQWREQWEKNNSYLQAAQNALNAGKWQLAVSNAKQVMDTPYWQQQIKAILQQAQAKIAASKRAMAERSQSAQAKKESSRPTPKRVIRTAKTKRIVPKRVIRTANIKRIVPKRVIRAATPKQQPAPAKRSSQWKVETR